MSTISAGRCAGCKNIIVMAKKITDDVKISIECRECGGITDFLLEDILKAVFDEDDTENSDEVTNATFVPNWSNTVH